MRIVFWNVDTQRDFMLPTGKLYVKGANKIIQNLEDLTTFARLKNVYVINTADLHTQDSDEFSKRPDYKKTFPPHCIEDTPGQRFITETLPLDFDRNVTLYKDTFDVFDEERGSKIVDEIINTLNPGLIVVYGVSSDVCVNYAVLGLRKRLFDVVVAVDAIKAIDNSPENIYNLYTRWLMEGAWLASVEYIKKFVAMRVK